MKAAQIAYLTNPNAVITSDNAANDHAASACTCHSEEITAVITLYDNGTICECNQAAGELLGCPPSKLTWQHISTFLPQLA